MDDITDIDATPPWLTKEHLVTGGAAAIAVASGLSLGVSICFHNHTPQQVAILLAFHQQAADELGGNLLCGAGGEALGECWAILGGVVAMGVS